jgi:hypothetical protein
MRYLSDLDAVQAVAYGDASDDLNDYEDCPPQP